MDKRTLFDICLKFAGITSKTFAERHGVSKRFLNYVLAGERSSANNEIESAIDDFISDMLPYLERDIEHAQETYLKAA